MIRQAHTYLAGAVSGTVLIAVAVAIFVMLVSIQAAKDWPVAGLVGGDDAASTSVGPGRPAVAVKAHRAATRRGAAGEGRPAARSRPVAPVAPASRTWRPATDRA